MNEVDLFSMLKKKKKSELIELLKNAYFEMKSEQRQIVFDKVIQEKITSTPLTDSDVSDIFDEVSGFYTDSINGHYYAPFDINSKNYMDVPEETSEWCGKYGVYLAQTSELSMQGFHEKAIECFQILFNLINQLGEIEIIFADEVGSWMVGVDEELSLTCYMTSLAKYCDEKDFVDHVVPLLQRDSYESLSNKVFEKAVSLGNKAQISLLKNEVKKLKIKTA